MKINLIEDMWQEAKKILPGYVYAVLFQNRKQNIQNESVKPSIFESIALKNIQGSDLKKLRDSELRSNWQKLAKWFSTMQKDHDGYEDYLRAGSVFVKEFSRRGLPTGNYKIANIGVEKNDEDSCVYDLQDMNDWLGDDICKMDFGKNSFSDIDSVEKLKYAIYTAVSLGSDSFELKKDNDDTLQFDLKQVLKVKAFDENSFGIDDQVLGSTDFKLEKDQEYNIRPKFITQSGDIDKITLMKSKVIEKPEGEVYEDLQEFLNEYRSIQNLKKDIDLLPYFGSDKLGTVFVGLSPDVIEINTEKFFTNQAEDVFKTQYLKPLGLDMSNVLLGNVVPVPVFDDWGRRRKPTKKEIEAWEFFKNLHIDDDMYVIALGKSTEQALGGRADSVLPHPKTLVYKRNSGELVRKLRGIKKKVDKKCKARLSYKKSGHSKSRLADATTSGIDIGVEASLIVQIQKADSKKQIVYGIVSDPYGKKGPEFDAHNEWIAPKDVENMSHNFMVKFRKINIQHRKDSKSVPVESSVEQYPSQEDYKKAMNNEPHSIYRRKFGSDVVHSGSWIMATRLSDSDWKDYQAGKLNAYSIEGTGKRSTMLRSDLPDVKIIDLEPKN